MQRLEYRLRAVNTVVAPIELSGAVGDAGKCEQGTCGAACCDACALACRAKQNRRGAVCVFNLEGDCGPRAENLNQLLPRKFFAFPYGFNHFGSFAKPNAHQAFAVSNDDERGEAEATAAFQHLRHAVYVEDFGLKPCVLFWFLLPLIASVVAHSYLLELQATFAGSISHCLDLAMEGMPTPVENNLLDTGTDCPFGKLSTDLCGTLNGLARQLAA